MSVTAPNSEAAAAARAAAPSKPKGFIVSPLYDRVFFIGSPLIALILGILIVETPLTREVTIFDYNKTPVGFFIGAFTFAHLFIVIFRSHLNTEIFRLYPYRFTAVPLLLFAAMWLSTWVLVFCSVLAVLWDVYHSGMQTFGLARIYDMRAGNDPQVGRKLDWILNILLYAGPITAGATLMHHIRHFEKFEQVGAAFFTAVPAYTESNSQYLTWAVVGFGVPFLIYYVYAYWRFSRSGYQVSPQKVALLISTGLCSIFAWGFNPFGIAFFVVNFFHALQYFAIVWWAENKNISSFIGAAGRSWAKLAALGFLLAVGTGYGLLAETFQGDNSTWWFKVFLVVSLMHFWYDSFIWSVRRRQV